MNIKIIALLTTSLALTACASDNSTFDPAKAKDYQARDAVYCTNKESTKYVDIGTMMIIVCENGKAAMIEKDKSFLEKLRTFL